MNRIRLAPLAIVWATMFVVSDARAYVDPGTGTILVQWLFGMAMASFAVLSVYWRQAKGFLSRMFGNATRRQSQKTGAGEDEKGRD